MSAFFAHRALPELVSRYVFLESLIAEQTVLELEAVAATGGESARFLAQRGAARVVAADRDDKAIARARQGENPENLAFHTLGELEEGGFDVIAVADARWWLKLQDQEWQKWLKPGGRLVLAVRHPDGLALSELAHEGEGAASPTYNELLAALQQRFTSVEVAVQTSLVGYSIAPYGVEEPDVSIDWSTSEGNEAAYYVFIAGEAPSGVDVQTISPLPSVELKSMVKRPAPSLDLGLDVGADVELEIAQERLREAEAQAQQALDAARENELTAAQALAERDLFKREQRDREVRFEEAEKSMRRLSERVRALEAAAQNAEQARARVEEQLQAEEQRLSEIKSQLVSEQTGALHLVGDLEAERASNQTLRENLEAAEAELERLRKSAAEGAQTATEAAQLQALAKSLQEAMREEQKRAQAAVDALAREKEAAEAASAALDAEQQSSNLLKQNLSALQADLADLKRDRAELLAKIERVREAESQSQTSLDEAQSLLASERARADTAERTHDAESQRMSALEAALKTTQKDLEERLDQAERNASRLEELKEQLEESQAALRRDLDAAETKRLGAEQALATAKQEAGERAKAAEAALVAARAELEEAARERTAHAALAEAHRALQAEYDALKANGGEAEKRLEAERAAHSALEGIASEQAERLRAAEAAAADKTKRVTALEAELEGARSHADENANLTRELAAARARLQALERAASEKPAERKPEPAPAKKLAEGDKKAAELEVPIDEGDEPTNADWTIDLELDGKPQDK